MALGHSPSIVMNGLVFYYDMNNIQKSFLGAPTTNLLPQPLSLSTNYSYESWVGSISDNSIIAPDGTLTATRLTRTSGFVYKRNTTSPTFAISPGQTITFSCWIKQLDAISHANQGITIWCYNGAGSGSRAYALQPIGTNWVFQTVTYTALTGETDFSFSFSGNGTQNAGDIAIWHPQVEFSSFATPFVFGTRANTQSIIDLTGKNTLQSSNLNFYANNTFSWPSDIAAQIQTQNTFTFGTGDFSLECWIYPYDWTTYNHMFAFPDQNTLALKANRNDGVAPGAIYLYTPTWTTYGNIPGWNITLNQWNHVVFTRSSSVGYAYLNGVSKGSYGGFTNNFGSLTLNIGNGWGTEYSPKRIDVAKVYNRALSAAEITQNYNALRSRFGL